MRELKVLEPSLKEVFETYNTFFKNKERITGFKNLDIQNYTKEKIHVGVLAVLTKAKIMDMEEIVKSLIKDYLNGSNKIYEDIKSLVMGMLYGLY
ncbi:hypothetical protein [Clostridium septicum]|uniref:hypothetical protein n=1 Tax=Clostridium septicum TaxID=1504 RepID=UPI001FAABEA9|nr:hypothetical protein [Clostridium septicum]